MSNTAHHQVQLGTTGRIPLTVLAKGNGQPVDATVAPTVEAMNVNGVAVDETAVLYSATIAQISDDTPATVTGEYQLTFDSSSFAQGDVIYFYITAGVSGTTVKGRKSAIIVDNPEERPVIQ